MLDFFSGHYLFFISVIFSWALLCKTPFLKNIWNYLHLILRRSRFLEFFIRSPESYRQSDLLTVFLKASLLQQDIRQVAFKVYLISNVIFQISVKQFNKMFCNDFIGKYND